MKINGASVVNDYYERFHSRRFSETLRLLKRIGARRIIELGAHPWNLTSRIVDDPELDIAATVSAEEVTDWPDDFGVAADPVHLVTDQGREARFTNYSANLERTRFAIPGGADTVLACEIIEHLVRAPHVMLLNVNSWLPLGGRLVMTTPNGCQFANPLRRVAPMPSYRAKIYERHAYVYSLHGLRDLVEKCGFAIRESGFWSVYDRSGLSRIYGLLEQVPLGYFREKFSRTIYLVAEKTEHRECLDTVPAVYTPSPHWEYIRRPGR